MTQVLIVVLGQPCEVVLQATRPDGPFANSSALTLWYVPLEVEAVSYMPELPEFRLAWIFIDESALDSPSLRACQQRLCRVAPVTIAVRHAKGSLMQKVPCPSFPSGVVLQTYTEITFPLVQTLITGFIENNAKKSQ